jgi:lysophospholipase L1-like esterase
MATRRWRWRRGPGRRWCITLALASLVTTSLPLAGPAGASARTRPVYDVSLGDSYGAGYQPVASARTGRDTGGFAYQVVGLAKAKGYDFTLQNFACDGATTATIIQQDGCALAAPGPDSVSYPGHTQAAAADRFIADHPGQIGLITVSIGGNDILGCAAAAIFLSCVANALAGLLGNLHQLLAGVRAAAGPSVPIVGLTYPDVYVGLYPSKDLQQKQLADVSVPGFEHVLNPALASAYAAVGATFIDVTRATGGYIPLTESRPSGSGGSTPVAVTDVCALTYFCRLQDVHPTDSGYALIARLIVATLPAHSGRRRAGK